MLTRRPPSSWGLQAQATSEEHDASDLLIKSPGSDGQVLVYLEAGFDVSPRDSERSWDVRISLDYPGIFIEAQGATRDARSTKTRSGIRGAKAGAVVRVLVDAAPPYTATEIARAANVNEGYLSRILDTLTDEGLIDRYSFEPVTRVDWPAMLLRC